MKKGFALIEMMTVVFILGIFASFFTPKYLISIKRAKESQCLANRQNILKAEMMYSYDHNGEFASDISSLHKNGYLDKNPRCTDGGSYVWVSTNPAVLACSIHYWPFTSVSTASAGDNSGPLPPVPAYSFASDFNNMEGLYGSVGQWKIENGFLTNVGSSLHKIFMDVKGSTASPSNYSVNLTATSSIPYGVYYRANGKSSTNGYFFYYSSAGFKVYYSKNGSFYTLKSAPLPKGFSLYGQTHNIVIDVNNTTHSIKVDGKEYLKFSDSRYSSGTVGLYTASSSGGAKFDAVSVSKI